MTRLTTIFTITSTRQGPRTYDLEILQTPVLEAFTDNAASMRSKLITIPRTNSTLSACYEAK